MKENTLQLYSSNNWILFYYLAFSASLTDGPTCSAVDNNLEIVVSCDFGGLPRVLVTECQVLEGFFEDCKEKV